jgi:hypothetical protein
MTTPAPSTLRQSHDVLKGSISQLIVLRDQLAGIDDIKAEQQKAQASLDETKRYLKQAQGEVKEAEHFRDQYLAEARDKQAESERLSKEIAEKRVIVGQLNDTMNTMRKQLGG